MAYQPTFNPQEIKLFNTYPGLRGAVTGRIHWANLATVQKFGTTNGKNPRAYHTCVYAAFIAEEKGEYITRQYIRAHNSSSNIDPTVRTSNLHNGEIGISIGANVNRFGKSHGKSGSAKTNTPVQSGSNSFVASNDSSSNQGDAEVEMAIRKLGEFISISEECYRAFKKGQLKTDGY